MRCRSGQAAAGGKCQAAPVEGRAGPACAQACWRRSASCGVAARVSDKPQFVGVGVFAHDFLEDQVLEGKPPLRLPALQTQPRRLWVCMVTGGGARVPVTRPHQRETTVPLAMTTHTLWTAHWKPPPKQAVQRETGRHRSKSVRGRGPRPHPTSVVRCVFHLAHWTWAPGRACGGRQSMCREVCGFSNS